MSASPAVTQPDFSWHHGASRALSWAGVPSALATMLIGWASLAGLQAPLVSECRPNRRAEGNCSIWWGALPVQWVLPLALTGALLLVLPAAVLTTRSGARLSGWFWLGATGITVTGLVPLAFASVLIRGQYFYAETPVDNIALYLIGGTAAAESVLIGVAVLVERARPTANRGVGATSALVALAGLGLVTATTLTSLSLTPSLLPVPLVMSAVLLAAVARLHRGRPGLARLALWLLLLVATATALFAVISSVAIGSAEGTSWQLTAAAFYGGPPLAIAGCALTGLLAGVRSPLRDH